MSRNIVRTKPPASRCKVGAADVREWQVRTITQSGDDAAFLDAASSIAAGVSSLSAAQPLPTTAAKPSDYGFEDIYVLLESQNKIDASLLSNGSLAFSLTELNNNLPITEIVQITVSNFWFPLVTSANAWNPDFYFYRKVYMRIAELPANQSIQARNFQYHFEFDISVISSIAVLLVPVKDTFTLKQPLSSISTLTLQFYVPQSNQRIPLPIDYMRVRAVPGTNPARFVMLGGFTTDAIAPVGPITAPGVAVYFNGFTSNNATANNRVNDTNGIFITNIIDSTTFETSNADFTPVTTPSECGMIIGKNKFNIAMTFTSIRATKFTNGLDYVH